MTFRPRRQTRQQQATSNALEMMAIADGLPPAAAVQIPQGQVNYSPQAVQNALEAMATGTTTTEIPTEAAATNTAPPATNSPIRRHHPRMLWQTL